MSFFASRLDHVGERQKEYAADPAVYTRDRISVPVEVTPLGSRAVQTAVGQVMIEEAIEADWAFDADALGPLGLPQRGDHLHYREARFEVVPIGDQTYTFITSNRKRLRVHTRQVIDAE